MKESSDGALFTFNLSLCSHMLKGRSVSQIRGPVNVYIMKLTVQRVVLYNVFSYVFQRLLHIDGHDLSDGCNVNFCKFHTAEVFLLEPKESNRKILFKELTKKCQSFGQSMCLEHHFFSFPVTCFLFEHSCKPSNHESVLLLSSRDFDCKANISLCSLLSSFRKSGFL